MLEIVCVYSSYAPLELNINIKLHFVTQQNKAPKYIKGVQCVGCGSQELKKNASLHTETSHAAFRDRLSFRHLGGK